MQIFYLVVYIASAVNVVSSNPCVGPHQELRYLFPYYQYAQMSSHRLQN